MTADSAIRSFTRAQVSGKKSKKKKRPRPQQLTPIEAMTSTEYKEWKTRREKIEREIELLNQEADHAHDELMERWDAGDPAFELNDYNLELEAKLVQAKRALEINFRARPKEVT